MYTWSFFLLHHLVHLLILVSLLWAINCASLPHLNDTKKPPTPHLEIGHIDNYQNSSMSFPASPHGSKHFTQKFKNETKIAFLNECLSRPLSPQLWMDLRLNEFLESYPEGDHLNLSVRSALMMKVLLKAH